MSEVRGERSEACFLHVSDERRRNAPKMCLPEGASPLLGYNFVTHHSHTKSMLVLRSSFRSKIGQANVPIIYAKVNKGRVMLKLDPSPEAL